MTRRIVIVGGSYAGITAAKEIFVKGDKSVHVTVISPSTKAFFNISSPRVIVEPEHINKIFFNIEDTLKKYSNGVPFEFIHGTVETSNFDNNELSVKVEDGVHTIKYDYLILASGAKAKIPSFKLDGTHENTINSLKDLNTSVKRASKIAVIGGGATACEVAGELGDYFGEKKSITLFAGRGPLAFLGESKSKAAGNKLKDLHVIVKNVSVSGYTKNSITIEDGKNESFDLVIPAHGILPNTKYIDNKYLDKSGFLKTNDKLRVEGHSNIIAFGDILAIADSSVVDLKYQQLPVLKELVNNVILGSSDADISTSYTKGKTTMFIPISKHGGIGVLFGWCVPNFLVRIFKSKDFLISKAGESFD